MLTDAWHIVQGKVATEVVTLRNNGLLPATARILMEAHAAFKLQGGSRTVSLQSKQAQQLVLEFSAAEVKQHTHEVRMLERAEGLQLMVPCALRRRACVAQIVQKAHMRAVCQLSGARATAGSRQSCEGAACVLHAVLWMPGCGSLISDSVQYLPRMQHMLLTTSCIASWLPSRMQQT